MLNVIILGIQERDIYAVTLRVLFLHKLVWPVNEVHSINEDCNVEHNFTQIYFRSSYSICVRWK